MRLAWALGMGLIALNAFAEELDLTGQACELWQDPQGVTHIRAAATRPIAGDLLAIGCMGYLHGKERFWQMDHFRTILLGRSAETLGQDAIRTDFLMRLLGLHERAEKIFAAMDPEAQDYWKAYAQGVNRGLRDALAAGIYEYKAQGTTPEPWRPEDSIGLALLQGFDQTRRTFRHDLEEQDDLEANGEDAPALFNPDGTPWDTAILKPGEFTPKKEGPRRPMQEAKNTQKGAGPNAQQEDATGSNNWVLAPSRSQSGNAWLANDPHLELRHPPFWHWVHVVGGKLDVMGASSPGLPFVASGSNRHVAWGLTNAYMDVAHIRFIPAKELETVPSERPVIWFKLWKLKLPYFFKTFRRTKDGLPVLPVNAPEGQVAVLSWTGFDTTPDDLNSIYKIMSVSNVKEADQAFAGWGLPTWNFVFADDQGGIGYRTVGKSPKNTQGLPFGIEQLPSVPKSKILSAEEMPHVVNPKRGYIVTANNRQWPKEAMFNSGRAHRSSFRAFRIEELLLRVPKHDLETQRQAQCDVQAVDARFLLPRMLPVLTDFYASKLEPHERAILDLLNRWDFEADRSCLACGIYRRWVDRVMEDARLDEVALYRKLLEPMNDSKLLKKILANFRVALDDLRIGSIDDIKNWGEVHRAYFRHHGKDRWLPKTDGLPTPGDENTVNLGASTFKPGRNPHFEQGDGASQRLIVEMSQPPRIYAILAGPNQDTPERNLNDPNSAWRKWSRCELERRVFPLNWSTVETKKMTF